MSGTILFIHGTGVRSSTYEPAFADAMKQAREAEISYHLEPCNWGDVFGARFSPKSLPRDEYSAKLEAEDLEDFAHWGYLFDDPLFELRTLTIPATNKEFEGLGNKPKYLELWEKIQRYEPSLELEAILKRENLTPYWKSAQEAIFKDPISEEAFRITGDETAESSGALARALVAKMTLMAEDSERSGPGREARAELVARMKEDWGQQVYGVARFFSDLFAKPATYILKRRRSQWTRAITNPIGDILLYQSHGDEVREYLKKKIALLAKPVVLLAHSLGGIASVDLMASGKANAERLITFGCQAPFVYEMGALESLKPPTGLPAHFPQWLNLYDENDFLSYLAEPVFGISKVHDQKINTGRPFPASHSAYLTSLEAWRQIRNFLPK